MSGTLYYSLKSCAFRTMCANFLCKHSSRTAFLLSVFERLQFRSDILLFIEPENCSVMKKCG